MDITIHPRLLRGDIQIIPSKSQAHRLLICAAFADKATQLRCPETNRDIEATADCLTALGAEILRTDSGYTVFPAKQIPEQAELNCCESGSTLRFMLPIVGALGVDATFQMAGRLPQRPLSPLWEEMERMGCSLSFSAPDVLTCSGRLRAGVYRIDGSISSLIRKFYPEKPPVGKSHIKGIIGLMKGTLRPVGIILTDPDSGVCSPHSFGKVILRLILYLILQDITKGLAGGTLLLKTGGIHIRKVISQRIHSVLLIYHSRVCGI